MTTSSCGSAAPKLDPVNGTLPAEALAIQSTQEKSDEGRLDGETKMYIEKIASIGYSLMGCGRLEEAEDLFRGLTSLDPWEPAFHVVLGSVCLAQKKLEEASFQLEEALRLNPRNVEALVVRGVMKVLHGRSREALADLAAAKMLDLERSNRALLRIKNLVGRAAHASWKREAARVGPRSLNSKSRANPMDGEMPVSGDAGALKKRAAP